MHHGFCSMGELYFIWERSFSKNQLCGCGLPFRECPFWETVSQEAFGVSLSEVDADRAIELKDDIGWKRYMLLRRISPPHGRYRTVLRAYGDLMARLYRGIASASSAMAIVDSSKDPVHGFLLSETPGFEVHVVHLVRDPRAVAFSWRRSRKRPEIHWTEEEMPKEHIFTSSMRWTGENAMVEALGRSAASYCRIRYEDFVVDPDATLDKIFAPYAWMENRSTGLRDLAVDLEPTHTVSGNPMRFQHGKIELRIDSEWQRVMTPGDQRRVTAIAWPLMSRYGYPLRSSSG
jgi:hypothetical protein